MDYEEGKKYEKKDFRKLYEELVKSDWFKKAYNNKSLGECPLDFPELKESEDERIRKYLIEELKAAKSVGELKFTIPQPTREECIAYLEKQKEQKPILEVFGFKVGDAVRLKDGDGRKHIIKSFEEVEGVHGPNFYHVEFEDNSARDGIYPGEEYPNGHYTQMEKFEEEQKLAEWSEEDKRNLNRIYEILGYAADDRGFLTSKRIIGDKEAIELQDFLKSLRPSWRPSEWQMSMLLAVINDPNNAGAESCQLALKSLYEQLKKLM